VPLLTASASDDFADSDDSADENECATGNSAKEDVKDGKGPKPAETESGSDEGSVYNPSESQSVKADEELE
jgi:hypothetical protein